MCRIPRRIQHLEKTTSSAEEDNWDYDKIQKINNNKKKGEYIYVTLLVNNVPIKFIIDSGSPVTLIPQSLFNDITRVEKMNTDYKDVIDNKIEFVGQTNATVKTNKTTLQLPLLITRANITPLMGLDWMKRLEITINSNTEAIKIHNIKMDDNEKRILKLKNEFEDLFYNNTEIKDTLVKINLEENANIIQRKRRPISIHSQDQVAEELKRLIKNGYLERATEITGDCFVSPAVITVKKDKSIKIALDSRKLNEATIKRKAQMPNMEELISRISRKISEETEGEITITKLDFDYAYGQLKLGDQTRNLCIFTVTGGEFTGYYRFLKGFYGLADIPTIFQERIDKTLDFKHPAWLDDIIIVAKGSIAQHEMEVKEAMKKLEMAGYRLNPKKCEFFKKETEWIGHKIDQNGIRPLQDKLEAITKIEIPKNEKELKPFLGAIQYLSKYIENLSAQTDILRKLLKKQNKWIWTDEHTKAFNNLKKLITQLLFIYGKPIELLTDHQALEPLIKRNRSNKTYSARLTRWLDRLAHFDIQIKHVAGKHLNLTDYLSRNPISKPEPIENYDEEYVINCIIPLLEFINTHGSITDEKERTARTDQKKSNQTNSQSNSRHVQKLQTNDSKHQHGSLLLSQQNLVHTYQLKDNYSQSKEMDLKTIELIEKPDPSAETLKLTTRWKEITKPGDYRYTQWQWKKYNSPRTIKAEQKKIEIELWQRKNNLLWQRMEGVVNTESPDGIERRKEFHRAIYKIRNWQPNETGQGTSRQQTEETRTEVEIPDIEDTETMSSGSESTIALLAINFNCYLGATGVKYINMGKASKIQQNNEWDLQDTVRQVEQKFATDLKTIAGETTNDEKLLKTLVCIEGKTLEQMPEEYKEYKNHLSTRFGVVFYDDKIFIPQALRRTIITLLHKGHPAINKMSAAARPFWWPKLTKEIQNKCDECIPCKMAGKSIKPQIPMSEINYLPPADKPNQEIQLDFIGPIRFKQRRFYILISIDRDSRWPAACICEAPTGKTAKTFLEQYILLNGIPQFIRTDKGTAFTGNKFRTACKKLNIKLIYGTP